MARRSGSRGGGRGGSRGASRGGGRGRRARGGGLRRVLTLVLVLVLLAGAGIAAALWIGLVPGVQLRDRRQVATTPTPPDPIPTAAPGAPDSATDPATGTTVPPASDSLDVEALLVAWADSAAGDSLYRGAGRCAGCHGAAGEGVERLGPNLRDAAWLHGGTRRAIRAVIADGAAPPRGDFSVRMPAYAGQLDEAQLARLAAFVWTLSRPGAVHLDSTPPPQTP